MVLGIDIGGTSVKFGVVNECYQILKRYNLPVPKSGNDGELVGLVIDMANEIKQEYSYRAIGIGTPGTIDSKKGVIIRASNLPFRNTPLVDIISEGTGVYAKITNDATCAICGELVSGIGKQYDNFIMVTLGTGVGGGIVIDRKPYVGKLGRAGEFGHIIIEKGGIPCLCGQRGCFEQYASVTALIKQTREMSQIHPHSILAEICKTELSGKTPFDAAVKGCPVAQKVIDNYTDYIAVGLQSLARAFQPEAIIIGGAISGQKENLTIPLKEKVTFPVEICTSKLENDAGILGAASIILENFAI